MSRDFNKMSLDFYKNLKNIPEFHNKRLKQWENLYKQAIPEEKDLARQLIQQQTTYYVKKEKELSQSDVAATLIKCPKTISIAKIEKPTKSAVKISVKPMDCLYAAEELVKKGKRVAVLNMANQFNAGGGYKDGAGAQEEDLFRRTNLVMSLSPKLYKKVKGQPKENQGFGEFNTLYSNKITVIRKGLDKNYAFYPKNKRFEISVISSAAYNLEYSSVKAGSKQYTEGTKRKIKMQLETAIQKGHKHLVLSAFGCGAFGNDPQVVSQMYKDVLAQSRYKHAFETVTFAIISNPGAQDDNYQTFKDTFTTAKKKKRLSYINALGEFMPLDKLAISSLIGSALFLAEFYFLGVSLPVLIGGGVLGAAVGIMVGKCFQTMTTWMGDSRLQFRDPEKGLEEQNEYTFSSSPRYLPKFNNVSIDEAEHVSDISPRRAMACRA